MPTITELTEISHQDIIAQVADLLTTEGWTVNREGAVGDDYELLVSHEAYGTDRFFALQTSGLLDGHEKETWIQLSGHDGYNAAATRFNQPGRPAGVYGDPAEYFSTDVVAQVNATNNRRAVVFAAPLFCYIFIEVTHGCWEHLLFGASELLSPRQVEAADLDRSGQFYCGRPPKANRDIENTPHYVWFDTDPDVTAGSVPTFAQMRKEMGILAIRDGGTKNGDGPYGGLFINRGTSNTDWAGGANAALTVNDTYNNLCLPQSSNNLRPMLPIETQVKTSSWYVNGYLPSLRTVNGISVRSYDEVVTHDALSFRLFPLPMFNRQGAYFEQTAQDYSSASDNMTHLPCLAVQIPAD